MELKTLSQGWHRHLRHFNRLRKTLAAGQDPKVFCISCCDSRVNVHEIFDMNEPGDIFEVKNVGGLFTDDAKAALVYALGHLKPDFIVVMHHTRCGGYKSLAEAVEPDVRRHMVEYGGFQAKTMVDRYLDENNITLPENIVEQLVLEEGCRIQTESIISFLKFNYPRLYDEIKAGKVKLLPLLYHTVTGKVCHIPNTLEGSEKTERKEL